MPKYEISHALDAWLRSSHRGISSNTIVQHLTGFPALGSWAPSHPHDVPDLGRCLRLLRAAPELRRLEMKHRFNADLRRLCQPLLPYGILSIARELLRENVKLRSAAEGLTGPHGMDPADCPTFHDGCHCTVENLVHNIERAEAAEAKLDAAWIGLVAAASKAFRIGNYQTPVIKARHIEALMLTLTGPANPT